MTLKEQLRRDEGLRLKPYKDTLGILTIGVGRNLTDVGISAAEADLMLDNDIERIREPIARLCPWFHDLDEARQGVILNMGFNMGLGGILQFKKMIAALKEQDWERAAKEMKDSLWARQVHSRADRLAQQMRTGKWT